MVNGGLPPLEEIFAGTEYEKPIITPPPLTATEQITPTQALPSLDEIFAEEDDIITTSRPQEIPELRAAPEPTKLDKALNLFSNLFGESFPAQVADAQIRLEAQKAGLPKDVFKGEVNPQSIPIRKAERFLGGIGQGAVGTIGSILGAVDWLSDSDTSKKIGSRVRVWQNMKAPDDPDFSDALASGFGSSAVFFIPGMAAAGPASKILGAGSRTASWLGVGASTLLESAAEAGEVFNTVLADTKDRKTADKAATNTFIANIPLIAVTNKLGVFSETGGKIKRAIASSLLEGSQEVGQEAIGALAEGRTPTLKELGTAGAVGAIVGGVSGPIMGAILPTPEQIEPTAPAPLPPTPTEVGGVTPPVTPAVIEEVAPPEFRTPEEVAGEPIFPAEEVVMPAAEELAPEPIQRILPDVVPTEPEIGEPINNIPQTEAPIIPKPGKPELTQKEGILPQEGVLPDEKIKVESLNNQYENIKDSWLAEKDWQAFRANVEASQQQELIKQVAQEPRFGRKSKQIDAAIQINRDLKRNPAKLNELWDLLTEEQKEIVTLSQNLPPRIEALAERQQKEEDALGLASKDEDIIRNVLDNHVNRIWEIPKTGRVATQVARKFGISSGHAKARSFETILDGWTTNRITGEKKKTPSEPGYKLAVESSTNSLAILKEEMNNAIQDKRFLSSVTKLRNLDGEPLLSTTQLPGYVEIQHPNFKVWKFSGKTEPADLRGKNFLQTPEGTVLERRPLYAPKDMAKNLNNIMGTSRGAGNAFVDAITEANAIIKANVLQSSLFHHLAFMRSYYLGSSPFAEATTKIKVGEGFMKSISELTPRQAYKSGQQAINALSPEIELLVRNGLTLGKIQEWEESILRKQDTFVSKTFDKLGVPKDIRDKINLFRQQQADFLFKQFGAGLKAKAALIELRDLMRRRPNIDPNEAAKIVSNLMNDDFGGLNLKRIGRSPTTQHVFRIAALAPDWTESNIRSMVKAIKAGSKEEQEVYRRFWARIITKSMLATLLLNALLHGKETADVYMKAWENGKLRWIDIDITPIYKMFGGDTDAQKYFSLIGHFKDPLKFALDPIKSAQYKASPVSRMIYESISGEDWAGREFTEFPEFVATGQTVRPKFIFGPKPNKYSQMPSYLASQLKGSQPIQVQELMNWWSGETEAFDAIGRSLGLGIGTTFEPTKEQRRQLKETRKTIRSLQKRKAKPNKRGGFI